MITSTATTLGVSDIVIPKVNIQPNANYIIKLNVEPFEYDINVDRVAKQLYILATHNTEFLTWKQIISNDITGKCDNMTVTYTPEELFDIFTCYKDKTLINFDFSFPKSHKEPDVPLLIELITTLSVGKKQRVVNMPITLEPEKISNDKRYDLKLKYMKESINKDFEQKTGSDITKLEQKIEKLRKQKNKLLDSCTKLSADNDKFLDRINIVEKNYIELVKGTTQTNNKITELDKTLNASLISTNTLQISLAELVQFKEHCIKTFLPISTHNSAHSTSNTKITALESNFVGINLRLIENETNLVQFKDHCTKSYAPKV